MGGDLRKHKSGSGQNEEGREKARENVNEWVSTMGRQQAQLAPLRNSMEPLLVGRIMPPYSAEMSMSPSLETLNVLCYKVKRNSGWRWN